MPDAAVTSSTALDQLCINTLRTLAMDAVQRANSGHPGTPMALAPLGVEPAQEHGFVSAFLARWGEEARRR